MINEVQALRYRSPALAAGASKVLWSMDDVVELVDAKADAPKRLRIYKTK